MKSLTIGQLAHEAGINPESVRFYEAQSLLPELPRSMAGYRMYTQDSVPSIRFIKRAQDLGFSLKEIKELLSLAEDRTTDCADVRGPSPDQSSGDQQEDPDARSDAAGAHGSNRALLRHGLRREVLHPDRLRRGFSMRTDRWATVSSIGVALLPKLTCPFCWQIARWRSC
jgi:DNA-binding transcriptional MerR regulator